MSGEWMSSAQAAAALGVKSGTLYAYVSRGVIGRDVTVVEGQRTSRFRRTEILALAQERSRPRAGEWSIFIESDVTDLDPVGKLAFRGLDIGECAERGFEATVIHVLGGSAAPLPFPARISGPVASRRSDAVRHTVLSLAATDPERGDIGPDHCRQVAITAIQACTTALTGAEGAAVAHALTSAWASEPTLAVGHVLDVALTVLVDHDVTASTLAARAAAGVRADPWMVLLTGLSAMSGSHQAGASARSLRVLRDWGEGRVPAPGPVPGFGHKVYDNTDPRAELVLRALLEVAPTTCELVESLTVHLGRRNHPNPYPNIDLALAATTHALGLPDDAGEAIFTVARIAGLMAHAMEEYPHGLRLRPRSVT